MKKLVKMIVGGIAGGVAGGGGAIEMGATDLQTAVSTLLVAVVGVVFAYLNEKKKEQ